MTASAEILFALLRAALGKGAASCEGAEACSERLDLGSVSGEVWKEVIDLSFEQGVAAIAVDGLQECLPLTPPEGKGTQGGESLGSTGSPTENEGLLALDSPELEDVKYEWFGEVFSCEDDYKEYLAKLRELMGLYRSEGIRAMVLKGYGLGLNYPIPAHRPTGDVDVYLINDDDDDNDDDNLNLNRLPAWKRGDEVIRKRGIAIDNSHHHHSVFVWKGLTVENHYDFVNVHSHRSSADVERKLKSLAAVGESVDGIDLPSADFNALFVIRHIAAHFAAEGMNLRQLLDWALFVREHSAEVDWKAAWECYRRWNMHRFVLCIDEIAVRWLGFERGIFGIPEEFADFGASDAALVDRVLEEILHPTRVEGGRGCLPVYVWRRFRQWWLSRWKHRIVYSDSLVSTFLWQVHSHLMKPATLIGK